MKLIVFVKQNNLVNDQRGIIGAVLVCLTAGGTLGAAIGYEIAKYFGWA